MKQALTDRELEALATLIAAKGDVVPATQLSRRRRGRRSSEAHLGKRATATIIHYLRQGLGADAIRTVLDGRHTIGYAASERLLRSMGVDPAPTLADVWMAQVALWLGGANDVR